MQARLSNISVGFAKRIGSAKVGSLVREHCKSNGNVGARQLSRSILALQREANCDSTPNVRKRYFSSESEKKDAKSAGPSGGKTGAGDSEKSAGFFTGLKERLEDEVSKNPDLGKSFEEVKASMPFSASAADTRLKSATEHIGKAAQGAADASEKLKAAAKESGDAAARFAATSAKAGDTFGKDAGKVSEFARQVWQELRPDSTKPGSSTKSADKSVDQGTKEDQSSSWGSFSTTAQEATKRLTSSLPDSFGNDDKTWNDALRAVFGLKPVSKKVPDTTASKSSSEEETTMWYEAVDKDSGEVYYYTADGKTVWEKPDELKTAEELAKDWADKQSKTEPSFLEKQIAMKVQEISKLEEERDAAMAASEMAKYKEVNSTIRTLRKEVESLSAQANATAVVHVEQERGAWEQFGDTLRDTPILKDLFGFGAKLGDTEAAKKARNVAEDAREAWETSQNPWVYSAYSAWESVFAETEMGETIRELRKLDPTFTFEQMLEELEEEIVPEVLKAYLRGDVETLDKWCSEAAAAAVKASINQRNAAGRRMDENILAIDHMQVAAAKVVDKMGPLVVVQFMVQQIDCLYDLKGKVVDGKDDKVAAVFYAFALGREYNEQDASLNWRIREFAIIGTQPWT